MWPYAAVFWLYRFCNGRKVCWWQSDRGFKAVQVDESSPHSLVNGEVWSISEEEFVERSGRARVSFLAETLSNTEMTRGLSELRN